MCVKKLQKQVVDMYFMRIKSSILLPIFRFDPILIEIIEYNCAKI